MCRSAGQGLGTTSVSCVSAQDQMTPDVSLRQELIVSCSQVQWESADPSGASEAPRALEAVRGQ